MNRASQCAASRFQALNGSATINRPRRFSPHVRRGVVQNRRSKTGETARAPGSPHIEGGISDLYEGRARINRGGPIDACQQCAKSASGQMASMAVYVKVDAGSANATKVFCGYTDN
jgi:hypothetical protein